VSWRHRSAAFAGAGGSDDGTSRPDSRGLSKDDVRPPLDAEVCIVGAGAAGGILAFELARRGVRVVVLESGPRHDFRRRGEYVRRYLKRENPWRTPLQDLDRQTVGGTTPYLLEWRRARGVGGSTLHWEGYALRLHADDFRLRSLHGVADDWPISYQDLEPYYARAETALGVAGAPDDPWASPRSAPFPLPPFPFSYSDGLFARACRSLGIAIHHLPQARNSVAHGGRPRCQACGTCHVCPTGAKATTDLTHVPQAEATGNARVITDATVLRLEVDPSGQVSAAVYAGPDKVERRLTGRIFVVAAGAVETARLLLLSTSRAFPNGLANRSGLVGKFFMSHPSVEVTGRAADRIYPYRIGFSTAMSRQFAIEGGRAARGAFFLEFMNSAGPTPDQLAIASGEWGEGLRKRVRDEFGRRLGIRVYCEQLPERANAVSLNTRVTDYFGNPVPHLHYSVGKYERRALEEAKEIVGKILSALALSDVQASGLMFAAHQIGTHRMGAEPQTSVVDASLKTHDVPNLYLVGSGCFVTASASPPTLTIAALAIRAAEHVATTLGHTGRPAPRSIVVASEAGNHQLRFSAGETPKT
jgi:choline dehydrogenase-like flavoprotein